MKDKTTPTVAVVGGDLRLVEAARAIADRQYTVKVYGIDVIPDPQPPCTLHKAQSLKEALKDADCVILPLPYSHDGEKISAPLSTKTLTLAEFYAHLSPKTLVAAGLLGSSLAEGYTVFDYSQSESFAIKNARATVEGAIAIAIRESPLTLCNSRTIVTGYGRIGKMLASTLKSLGAYVTVIARSQKDLSWAWSEGIPAYPFAALPTLAATADLVFNTVPSLVIERPVLYALPQKTPIIELASLPGGVDLRAADEEGVRVITALGLPGKYSPATAGRIIAEAVLDAMKAAR